MIEVAKGLNNICYRVVCNNASLTLVKVYLLFFPALGAAYGTAKSGTGIAAMSIMRPELIMKSVVPVVMAGIIAIYGVVIAVLISQKMVVGMPIFK